MQKITRNIFWIIYFIIVIIFFTQVFGTLIANAKMKVACQELGWEGAIDSYTITVPPTVKCYKTYFTRNEGTTKRIIYYTKEEIMRVLK